MTLHAVTRVDNYEGKIYLDTEFAEDGRRIDPLSIGLVRDDGAYYYAEFRDTSWHWVNPWVRENVLPHLEGWTSLDHSCRKSHYEIRKDVIQFCGKNPEFWAYYADYDWVLLCQLMGTMSDLPAGWPMYCKDLKQWCDYLDNPELPSLSKRHHALDDALELKARWEFLYGLEERGRRRITGGP